MVEALRNIRGDVALLGISNQGFFMPLVAAQRPVRRIAMINVVVPHTRQGDQRGAFDCKEVFATWIAGMLAQRALGFSEVCGRTA